MDPFSSPSAPELLELGLVKLRSWLGDDWSIASLNSRSGDTETGAAPGEAVTLVNVQPPDNSAWGQLVVEARTSLGPMDVPNVLNGQVELLRKLSGTDTGVLVVAPWLSPRTREVLEERGYGYLDLTGNAWLKLHRPAVFIRLSGSERDPEPGRRRQAGLAGPLAGRLVRTLVDVAPPYRPAELADHAGLKRSYVSRLLESLESQALIFRQGTLVANVDWVGLLRARAERYELLDTNASLPMVSPDGTDALRQRLRRDPELAASVTVTGPVAAAAVAPASVGGQLMLYTPDPEDLAERLGLLPASGGADVVLLAPSNSSIVERARVIDGLRHVALSQLVLDSLSGNGRLPADGEAVLLWMKENEQEWRLAKLAAE